MIWIDQSSCCVVAGPCSIFYYYNELQWKLASVFAYCVQTSLKIPLESAYIPRADDNSGQAFL